ncbi:MAG: heterodisulfide reductase-related iron-sulfur binding cluster [Canidatus Methanoxibalbensis ujae]|nr:heterodisulfide reductase-related iron-sulfur binding cluster [Candidatus Methanoxibalbensis ujae]MCW7079211.1 heterodisulfide reductase-related iron-sulfur binding cluster [Candidatus Methanoxibalbensis ujae]
MSGLTKDDIMRAIYHCVKCKLCSIASFHPREEWSPLCPSGAYFGFQAFYAPGKMEIFRELLEGRMNRSEGLIDAVFACTLCGACYEKCRRVSKVEIPLVEIFEEMRSELSALGWQCDVHREIADKVRNTRNAYGEERASFDLRNLRPSEGANVLYFIGCTARYRVPEIADAMLRILNESVEYQVLEDEWCCCSVLIRTGQRNTDIVREHVRHNYDAIVKSGADTVVFTCPGCLKTLKIDYPMQGADLSDAGIELIHATEFIRRIYGESALKKLPLTVTYHDPCHLGRDLRIYDAPRDVLRGAVQELREMRRVREEAWCCGSGGGVKSAFNDFAVWCASERLKEAAETGADAIVSACPFCKRNLRDASTGMRVLDVVEVIEEALLRR